ncbi:MAG: isoprenylcysteine carboxylmethyltransferase family protein, partial [Clostridia bacterium]|nr:isoprenylcysteine carboxylmethyltransferase family protein [Clostridia bacterium]
MTKKLLMQAITKVFSGIVLVGILIFAPAGTFSFSGGWILMGVLFIPMLIAGTIMMFKNPELLKRRLKAKEKLKKQSVIVLLSGIMFSIGFIIAGLGVRFSWYLLPEGVMIGASALFLLSYL